MLFIKLDHATEVLFCLLIAFPILDDVIFSSSQVKAKNKSGKIKDAIQFSKVILPLITSVKLIINPKHTRNNTIRAIAPKRNS